MVLYRNRMLYMNRDMQSRQLKQIFAAMEEGTIFITGVMESIKGYGVDHLFRVISNELKIYAKAGTD